MKKPVPDDVRLRQVFAAQLQARARGAALAGEPPSPCISVCRIDESSGLCEGCFRTLDEIARWGAASGGERRAVWQTIAQRVTGDARLALRADPD
jgi:predicted Fe-S protein YdhL (DUF1289 family)